MSQEETIRFSGLPVETAVSRLRAQGTEPQVVFTRAPRGAVSPDACARVIRAQEGGRVLTVAYFEACAGMRRQE